MIGEMPERPPHVMFETRAEEDRNPSIDAGHPVYKDVDYAIITPPGGNLVVERSAKEWLDQQREKGSKFYPMFQQMYDQWKQGAEMPEFGTPIKLCPIFSPAEVKQINGAGIRSVEDLATFPDGNLTKLGMGARRLKDRALAWLESANSTGKAAEEMAALKAANADLQETVKRLSEKLDALSSDDAPKRRGRPPNQQAAE